jgi:hypothetical protein
MEEQNNWKIRTYVIGGVVGLLAGLGAAYVITRRAEETQQPPRLTTGDGMKIGMSLASVFKLITDIVSPK